MGILAQRERRRFNQVRKLGFNVPISYVRIRSIKTYPEPIQKELLTYFQAITADSDFEEDEVVVEKYHSKFN
jgi:hypothetical protein